MACSTTSLEEAVSVASSAGRSNSISAPWRIASSRISALSLETISREQ